MTIFNVKRFRTIERLDADNKILREVNYNVENARFQSGMYLLSQSIELSEIIGNIYENPELINKEA